MIESAKADLIQTASDIIGGYPLDNDICHRKAPSVARLLVSRLGGKRDYSISLVHLVGHSAACLTDQETGLKMIINTGYLPPRSLLERFSFFGPGFPHPIFGNSEVAQIESLPLRTERDVDNAQAWSIEEARGNRSYYSTG